MSTVGMPVEKSENFSETAKRLIRLMADEKYLVILVMFLAVVSVALVVLGPRILGHATDILFDGLTKRDGQTGVNFTSLHRTLELALGLYVLSFILAYSQTFMLAGVVQRTMFTLRADVEAKIHKLPLSYIDRHSRGDLLSRVTNDIDNISQSLQQSLSQLITSLLTIAGVLIMMLALSPILAIIAIITVPLSISTMNRLARRSKQKFIAQWSHTGALNGLIEETFTGHAIVKTFGRQRSVEERFATTNEKLYEAGFGAQFISGSIQPAMMFVGNLNYLMIAVVGGIRVASGSMGLGDVQAFIQYSRQFTQPLTQTASMMNVLQSGVASAERVFEVLDTEEESAEAEFVPSPPVQGRVAFENVSFSYNPDRPLITDLSLVAEPGTTVAIVGPTGAGKTTLVNLIMRFYELNGGRITLDGRDISLMPRSELRSNIGMVLQDTWLFGGTIRENIAYGKPSATEEQIRTAAKAAYVDRFVHSLPMGYDTILDNEGGAVSAGEKQLLTIARAFLADPTILILDEATSSVDTRTEVLIQRAMVALRSQRTSFVIAHRLSTIRDANVILVMEDGRIVEQGSHEELLASRGAYYRLYQSQFSGAATDID
ncbi:MAG: ABC transporter ATP-binding protein/permease [Ilumatobacteraceae bacterium]|nr:ABC transporter ATP-binding protein/permease [Ilumatobacteraceae bacterium]MDP5069105.1 ABC transporter ATP-binding protein/permease [Ilumatobacteraceae bacterium]